MKEGVDPVGEVGIDERPQSEPIVWKPSAAILMVANSQDQAPPGALGYRQHKLPSICYLQLLFSFFLSPSGGEKGPRSQMRPLQT